MKRHATDVVALAVGIAFLAIVAVWALAMTVTIELPDGGWFIAGGLVVMGAVGLAAAFRLTKT